MRDVRKRVLIAVCMTLALSGQSYSPDDMDSVFGRGSVVIQASAHACYKFDVWVARSGQQMARGLMFVRELAPAAGMFFVYGEPRPGSIWMKNTFIPLDILFIRADGRVSTIFTNAEPQSLRSMSSVEAVAYTLELNGGTTEELGIASGDQQ